MGRERVDGKIQSGVKPPQSKKTGSGLNFWEMITLASSHATAERPGEKSALKLELWD
jgi:hypothetical protein